MIAYFQGLFTEGGAVGAVAQVIGFAALILLVASMQQKTQTRIAVFQVCSGILWTTHMLMLGAWTGAVMNGIGVPRAGVFAFRAKYDWARHFGWRVFFILLCVGGASFSAVRGDGWLALLPLTGMILTTFALSCDRPFRVRLLSLINQPFWLIYNLCSGSISGVACETLNILSTVVAMLRLDLPAYRQKKKKH